jgi:hypothetical protein
MSAESPQAATAPARIVDEIILFIKQTIQLLGCLAVMPPSGGVNRLLVG